MMFVFVVLLFGINDVTRWQNYIKQYNIFVKLFVNKPVFLDFGNIR